MIGAFDTLFNKRDYDAAERLWSPHYIQHSSHIGPDRAALFDVVKAAPPQLRYEDQLTVAEGDYVILYGRGDGPNWTSPMSSASRMAS